MANISQIKTESNWGDEAPRINQNFQNINVELLKVKSDTTNNKGYFSTEEDLKKAYPSEKSKVGMIAYVGATPPYAIYEYKETGWTNTEQTYTPEVNLGDYYNKSEVDALFDKNAVSIELDETSGDLSVVMSSDNTAFESGSINENGDLELIFEY